MKRRSFFRLLLGAATATALPAASSVAAIHGLPVVRRTGMLRFACHEKIGVTIANPKAVMRTVYALCKHDDRDLTRS
jgi:hypothetical protein